MKNKRFVPLGGSALIRQSDDIIQAIDRSIHLQPSTRGKYKKAVEAARKSGIDFRSADQVLAYADGLSTSVRNNLKSAIRIWSNYLGFMAKAGATPENIGAVQATLYRLEALNQTIKIKKVEGAKAHTWLTQSEVKKLLDSYNVLTIQGQRDRLILGLLVGAGLRREELAALTFADVVMQPVAGKFRTVLNVHGKGAKDRIVPISDRLAAALDQWGATVGTTGAIARSISKGGSIGIGLTAVGIFQIVAKAGAAIGRPALAPHDLRRTYAQLGYEAGVPITQISKLLGHADVGTTQRYLNLSLDLASTVSDFIPF